MPQYYEAVLLDSDDTLTATYASKHRLYAAIGLELNPPVVVTEPMLRQVWGRPIPVITATLYPGHEPEVVEAIRTRIEHRYPVTALPDTIPTLAALQSVRMPLAVVSSTSRLYLDPALLQAGVPFETFLHIQGGEATTVHKPDPEVFQPVLRVLDAAGIRGPKAYVGDRLDDWFAARDADLDFFGVTSGITTLEEFKDNGAPVVVSRLLETLPYLLLER